VTQGQTLAVIDSPELSAKLSQEEATLQALQTDWQRARLDADRKTAQLLAFERQPRSIRTRSKESSIAVVERTSWAPIPSCTF